MYCPNCGAQSTQGLNYCKRCGGNLSDAAQPAAPASRNVWAALILALATAGLVLGGFGIVFSLAFGLVGPQPEGYTAPAHDVRGVAAMMIAFGSGTIALVTILLIRLFSRLMGFGSENVNAGRSVRSFVSQAPAQIPAPPIQMHSVTEHTTRNFEPRMRERDALE